MKFTGWFLLSLLVFFPTVSRAAPAHSIGPGSGILVGDIPDRECDEVLFHSDGTYENGWGWTTDGVQDPDYGSWAECFHVDGEICALQTDLTRSYPWDPGPTMDVFIWLDDGGIPGTVFYLLPDIDPGPAAIWPAISRHRIELAVGCSPGRCNDGT